MTKINKGLFRGAVVGTGGTLANVARNLKVDRSAVTHYLKKHPEMMVYVEEEREKFVDIAENEFKEVISLGKTKGTERLRNDPKIISLRLRAAEKIVSTLGRNRGWVEKQEVEHSGKVDNKMEVEVVIIEKKEDEDTDDSSLPEHG